MEGNDGTWERNIKDFRGQDHDQQDGGGNQAVLVNGVVEEEPGPSHGRERGQHQEDSVDTCAKGEATHGSNPSGCSPRPDMTSSFSAFRRMRRMAAIQSYSEEKYQLQTHCRRQDSRVTLDYEIAYSVISERTPCRLLYNQLHHYLSCPGVSLTLSLDNHEITSLPPIIQLRCSTRQ